MITKVNKDWIGSLNESKIFPSNSKNGIQFFFASARKEEDHVDSLALRDFFGIFSHFLTLKSHLLITNNSKKKDGKI